MKKIIVMVMLFVIPFSVFAGNIGINTGSSIAFRGEQGNTAHLMFSLDGANYAGVVGIKYGIGLETPMYVWGVQNGDTTDAAYYPEFLHLNLMLSLKVDINEKSYVELSGGGFINAGKMNNFVSVDIRDVGVMGNIDYIHKFKDFGVKIGTTFNYILLEQTTTTMFGETMSNEERNTGFYIKPYIGFTYEY